MVILHGAGGFADELIVVVLAFGLMWLAVRLSRRKPADETEVRDDEQPPRAPEST